MRFCFSFLIAILVTHSLLAQLPENNGAILFEDIKTVPGVTSEQLRQKLYEWASKQNLNNFTSSGSTFIGTGRLGLEPINSSADWFIQYSISIEIKENRYRIKAYNFREQIVPQKWLAEKTGSDKITEYDVSKIYDAYRKNLIGIDKGPFQSKRAWRKRTEQMITTIKDNIDSLILNLNNTATKVDNW